MFLTEITLLSLDEYQKYRSLIPDIGNYWWFKTQSPTKGDCVLAACNHDDVVFTFSHDKTCGVRPFCVFEIDLSNPRFWCRPEKLVGSKIEYGVYKWTVLDFKDGCLYALCDALIAHCRFDKSTSIWEESRLKEWLGSDGKELITPTLVEYCTIPINK